jgi:hypothetical protein
MVVHIKANREILETAYPEEETRFKKNKANREYNTKEP